MAGWVVDKSEAGQRLGVFIKARVDDDISMRRIKRWLERGVCSVNRRHEKRLGYSVAVGDRIDLDLTAAARLPLRRVPFSKGRILFDDEDLLVYDKPPGLSCDEEGLLLLLQEHIKEPLLVHRLDKNSSGAVIVAKSSGAQQAMEALFRRREVDKEYLALVDGTPAKDSGVVTGAISKRAEGVWAIVPEGKEAVTQWKCQQRLGNAALLCCQPITGRTHQIRLHLQSIGHPILGDVHYCKRYRCPYHPPRQLLHAEKIGFVHPTTGRRVEVTAALPDDFQAALDHLTSAMEEA